MARGATNTIREHIVWSKKCREEFRRWRADTGELSHVSEVGLSDLYPGYDLGREKPWFHLLVYTSVGVGWFYSKELSSPVRQGEVLIVSAGTPFGYRPLRGRWRFAWFHIPNNSHWGAVRGSAPVVRKTFFADPLQQACEGFIRESRRRSDDAKEASALYARLISLFLHRELTGGDQPDSSTIQERLQNLLVVVSENITKNWTVADLAELMSMAPSHLYRVVREYAGAPPMKSIMRLRMQRAQELLITRECSIQVVADMVGYTNQFAFAAAFKRFTGMSPGAFRKKA